MGSEWTLHTGAQGEEHLIHLDWFDENNVRQRTELLIAVDLQDKPRLLHIQVDGVLSYTVRRKEPEPG